MMKANMHMQIFFQSYFSESIWNRTSASIKRYSLLSVHILKAKANCRLSFMNVDNTVGVKFKCANHNLFLSNRNYDLHQVFLGPVLFRVTNWLGTYSWDGIGNFFYY